MGKQLVWDQDGEKLYETGTKKGVLYPLVNGKYAKGYAWNGLTGVDENPSGAEITALYADDVKYLNMQSAEEFGITINAYTYPDEFAECDGSAELDAGISIGQQTRKKFGFSYVTTIGNDEEGVDYGYKIHLVYGCSAQPSSKSYASMNENTDAMTLSWECQTTPVAVTGKKPTSIVTVDSTKVTAKGLKAIEDALYGTEEKDAYLPTPDEIVALVKAAEAVTDPEEDVTE